MPRKLITLTEANLNDQCLEEPLSLLLAECRILKGREGNNLLVHACRTNSLFFPFLFSFLSLFVFVFPFIFPFSSFFLVTPRFYFMIFKFSVLSSSSLSLLSLYTARTSFYSACCDWILLFQPLTAFFWSRCICRPPRLCATPHHQTKMTILFVSLP